MSKTTLADLRRVSWQSGVPIYLQATTQDLIKAVESIGGEVVSAVADLDGWAMLSVTRFGRYLVLRIEEDE